MKVLPITMLFHEGPIARSYLARLRSAGFRVRKIIRMIPPQGPLMRLLPAKARMGFAAKRQDFTAHYWPRRLPALFPKLASSMTAAISQIFGLADDFFEEICDFRDLGGYADEVLPVEINGLRDPALVRMLRGEENRLLLFTGGGIVPKSVLELPGVRLLHVHPGHLPEIRGADGLLWSTLIRGRPGASIFFMKPGIDEGELVEAQDFQPLTFEIPLSEAPDDQSLYRMIFSFYDPVLRAHLLQRVIADHPDLSRLKGVPQDLARGRTYHFLEARLRHFALRSIFK